MKRGDPGYWKWRGNTGKPKNLKSPKQLLEAAKEYFAWVDDNPLIKNDFIKSGDMAGSIVAIPISRPYTWQGLEMWLRDKGLLAKLDDYRSNKDQRYTEYADILAYISQIIFDQKYSGAAVGLFNSNLIAKDLGLVDRTENTIISEQPIFPEIKD